MLFAFIVILASLYLTQRLYQRFPFISQNVLFGSYLYHTTLATYYWYYSLTAGADALSYYEFDWGDYVFAPGTYFIVAIVDLVKAIFPTNYYSVTLLFNFCGFFGLWFFYISAREQLLTDDKYAIWLLNSALFIPGLNFWTSAIGKDSLIFLGIGLTFYAVSQLEKRKIILWFALALIFYTRPHVAATLAFALTVVMLIGRTSFLTRLFLGGSLTGAIIYFLPQVLSFIGLESIDVENIESYTAVRQTATLEGGSALDISHYNFLQQLFAYLFRPLFFDAHNLFALAASVENLIYLYLVFNLLKISVYQYILRSTNYVKFLVIYILIMLLMLAPTTANLGIAVRQKNMFIYGFIILSAVYASYKTYHLNKKIHQNTTLQAQFHKI